MRNCLAVDDLQWMAYSLLAEYTVCSVRQQFIRHYFVFHIKGIPCHLFSANVQFTFLIKIDRNNDLMQEYSLLRNYPDVIHHDQIRWSFERSTNNSVRFRFHLLYTHKKKQMKIQMSFRMRLCREMKSVTAHEGWCLDSISGPHLWICGGFHSQRVTL